MNARTHHSFRLATILATAAAAIAWGGAASAAAWTSTATQAIPLVKATDLGALAPNAAMRITVALKLPNASALRRLVEEQNTRGSAQYGKILTPAQFNAQYAPTNASAAAVSQYLREKGFTGIATTPNRLFITANGTAKQVEAAFGTKLERFSQRGKTIFVNTKPAQVPAALSGIVLSVLGLNDVLAQAHPKAVTPCDISTPTCLRLTYDPPTYWRVYDAGTVPRGTRTSIAVMAEGDVSSVVTDLRKFETVYNLPKVPVTIVRVGLPSPDTAGADEWDLDTQYTTGMAGNAKHLYIYATTSLTDQDTTLEFNKWVTQDVAQVANASFGICESFPYADGSMVADDQVFLEGAAQGQTMFSSTGDTGSFCSVGTPNGVPAGVPLVGYPAASPYVVAVGGTTLLSNTNGTYKGEIAWNAGGGGISQFEYSPYWQQNVVPTSVSGAPVTVRAIPDVAMDADPDTGAIVYVNGTTEVIGGTSLSSPLAVGVWARMQSDHQNRLGFALPKLYASYPAFTGTSKTVPSGVTRAEDGFHDVMTGANGAYTALPNYDYTTGMGSFDVKAKNAVIGSAP
ncbi:MAG TPA: S53 family peptidase [Alphaproteobacteria bacterium]|jgi:subtilase family serine protease|nr:S53 family peptidase [Alphaproteobacteria bacterium]